MDRTVLECSSCENVIVIPPGWTAEGYLIEGMCQACVPYKFLKQSLVEMSAKINALKEQGKLFKKHITLEGKK